ncbi:hypothetical protein AA23498_3579 [Acetobacter nitrogenifigens DSM 23921 = NBRC 105050]|uniref:Uncharacterized protein n=1 Tax=Acetobacter nitrogenifigens DSM 23921 = NBRC 105050 TaxID=1120919 RepID=A0A511XE15_9PROT|nr:hypothetical protein [Acetobacter nitrogenifigens]GBQ99876.1 hypothetical protein AA23498_3579 [Acetobacter nitrogenifigens DSM 23921 = NBRC 105050]GEN61192.1 hypothetical protein ANI02nite_30760 [Acetobacter nitrogenifigens DSM 23921 = NBRC 105050]
MRKPQILSHVICDEVRREDNGKQLLIGVYSEGMIYSGEIPGHVRICVWIQIQYISNAKVTLEVDLSRNGVIGENILTMGIPVPDVPSDRIRSSALITPIANVPVEGDETYIFSYRFSKSEKWKTLREFNVEINRN